MIYFLILLALTLPSMAQKSGCVRYQFEGEVRSSDGTFTLTTQKGTRSQKVFLFTQKDLPRLAPYIDKFAHGEFILPDSMPISGTTVLSLNKIDFAIPDPLQIVKGLVKLGNTACPKP